MQRRLFIRLAGGGVVAAATATTLAGCSSAMPPEAIAAWQAPGEGQSDARRWILSHAILAPHSHNLQSWLVDLSVPDEITLFIDQKRLLPETDPFSRQMMMSQGTFLELLDLAAKQKGLRAEIALFPQGVFSPTKVDARPTARIRLVADASVKPDPLFAQILRRRTNREAYEAREPEAAALQALTASVQPHPVRVGALRLHVRSQQFFSITNTQLPPFSNSELLQLRLHLHCAHAETAHHASSVTASVAQAVTETDSTTSWIAQQAVPTDAELAVALGWENAR